jgi:tRNA (adenine37-N6)-methyltransferase
MIDSLVFRPIGVVRSPFTRQEGTPIQPGLAPGAEGEIELDPAYADALADLDGFGRIWVLYVFDRATAYRPRVVPYLDDRPRGLFATRAPGRPNPIGMSPLRLLAIAGTTLRVADLDILDGTPVLDVKPYVPAFDAFPGVRAGWLDAARRDECRADGRFADPGSSDGD